jgi:heme a synthase
MTAPTSLAPVMPDTRHDRAIGFWLLICAAMIFAMAVIGAITRLTESGLSIMEWAPLSGALPPLSETEWDRLFALYRQIPEYLEENAGMTLAEFKTIFWWEWIHRLWGRSIGVVFAIPFLWFLARGWIDRRLGPHLGAMFVLGGLQGGLGWYMVASGFAERVDVSQYRLVAHLTLAVAIYAYVLWIAMRLLDPAPETRPGAAPARLRAYLIALAGLAGITMASGGFVAGLNAGLIYNTFPLMDGRLIPKDYAAISPLVLNLFENTAAVQFNHRVLAISTVLLVFVLWAWSRQLSLAQGARHALTATLVVAMAQLGLGIATLILVVPVWLGALHQAGALALLSLILWTIHRLRPGPERGYAA